MSSFNDIKKISYTDNRDSIVALKEYILFKDEVKQRQLILFKFQNNLNQELYEMKFDVINMIVKASWSKKLLLIITISL